MKNKKALLSILLILFSLCIVYSKDEVKQDQPGALEKAEKYFNEKKNEEGLVELSSVIKASPKSSEALSLWIKKGESVYNSIDYKLSYFTAKNEDDNKMIASLTALRDKVKNNLKDAGFKIIRIYLVGDSTVADYIIRDNYQSKYYPMSGWGESFQERVSYENLQKIRKFIDADSAVVINKSKGGRSTRTFMEEGSWKAVYSVLEPGDFVFIQFGHNDSSVSNKDRYVDIPGFKEYLAKYIKESRDKKAIPVLITPVNRNYPWASDTKLTNSHGEYPEAMRLVAKEFSVPLVDLNERSLNFFNEKGKKYVSYNYFIPRGVFPNYTEKDENTHFQINGAKEISRLVYEGLYELAAAKK